MSEEDRIELKKELSVYSKEELLEKYIDELEENHILTNQWYKSSQRINRAREYIEKNAITNISYLGTKATKKELFKDGASLYELLEILRGDKE